MERMVRVEAVLDSWKTVRQDTAQAVLDMPDLDFQPTPDLMKFRDLAVHTLNAGHALAGLLLDGVDNMATPGFRERMSAYFLSVAPDADQQTIAAALTSAIADDDIRLRSQNAQFWSQIITRFDGQQVTRLEMLQFIKEHELTHRSQMFMYLRLKGIVPPTTRRKLAKK
ncbi:MAG: hypothetical protein IT168_02680 [Bryobacterales bacterium]|nr:hypothetical protein [Bryobacterales bacterium]